MLAAAAEAMSYSPAPEATRPLPPSSAVTDFRPRLTYAITPPNRTTPPERRRLIAARQSACVTSLPLDALLVYDVQDEAARNGDVRPFAFVPKVDPLSYAFEELQVGALPTVVYRAVAEQGAQSLCRWLDRLQARGGVAVLVGAPSRRTPTALSLSEALSLCRRHAPRLAFGGVVIPERHHASGDEDARVWAKAQHGCGFFVSQTVWSLSIAKQLLLDLRARATREGGQAPHLLLTFSPCGSQQTLQFTEWLGVALPPAVKRELLAAPDMLTRSIELAFEAFAEIRAFAAEHGLSIGCNVESVSTRMAEVEASVELVRRIDQLVARDSTAGARALPSSARELPVR